MSNNGYENIDYKLVISKITKTNNNNLENIMDDIMDTKENIKTLERTMK